MKSLKLKKLLFIFLLISCRQIKAQTYVLIPDANFAAALQTIVPTAMSGNSLNTSSPLVTTSIQSISVPDLSISNLSGIQYFSSLTDLDCSTNSLTSLPALPNSLQSLYCFYNYLTSLPVLPNSLINLWCNSNSLTSLPVLPNSLQILHCDHNGVTALPALTNTLTDLTCNNNSLTSLPALSNSLQVLYCEYNLLKSLPTLPNTLIHLTCNNNYITCFPSFPSFSILNILNNPFTCLPNYTPAMDQSLLAYPLCSSACTAGIEEFNADNNQINIYPNPTSKQFTIETNSNEMQTIALFDLSGRLILTQNISDKTNIDVTSLSEGVYNLTIKNGRNIINKKLVIVK